MQIAHLTAVVLGLLSTATNHVTCIHHKLWINSVN